ncbi:MAG: DUF1491 family protein [Sphingomonas sp.]|jgi:hypothetical protein|uniref:DUF1491 family protein n=1 Tax=Sphingomonas sp. TaxID=28214 RepID=UPI0025CCA4BC|nr:DUF1491 family protein [Sphingomonas sp.]MBX9881461.1 DUF1491 family protein [Sphingomonas sp.]
MSDRLPTHLRVGALLRRVNDSGGMGMVRAKGEPQGGAVLLIVSEKGADFKCFERGIGAAGVPGLIPAGPIDGDAAAITEYWQRRRARDPDLWVIELDVASHSRFTAETTDFY